MELNLENMRIPLNSSAPKENIKFSGAPTLNELVNLLKDTQVYVPKGGYHDYIKSDLWKSKSRAMRAYFKTCAICNSTKKLCVHHKHYETVGCEGIEDLTVLCGDHHWEYEEKRIKAKEQNENSDLGK